MSAVTYLARVTSFSRPTLHRLAQRLRDAVGSWRARREFERQSDAATLLSERVLADIGAPDWLRHEAALRRERETLRLAELRLGSGRDAVRHG